MASRGLTKRDREALAVAADGRPIYRFGDGPCILRTDGTWLRVTPAGIARLERAGLIAWVDAYWLVTDAGRGRVAAL
jgi:hypothetical protein